MRLFRPLASLGDAFEFYLQINAEYVHRLVAKFRLVPSSPEIAEKSRLTLS